MFWIQLITSVLGALGFAIMFRVRPRYLAVSSVVGGICFSVYWLFDIVIGADPFVSALLSSIVVSAISEVLARLARCPAIVFLLAGIIPIVPGSFLYRMMRALIEKNVNEALTYGSTALKISLGVAGGIVVVSAAVSIILGILNKITGICKKTKNSDDQKGETV
jgi:uncharacterized membrane protein YjjB (DUF3815 family)